MLDVLQNVLLGFHGAYRFMVKRLASKSTKACARAGTTYDAIMA
jgi:hypothetical protein